ncbi:thiamine phosphate synthase [Sphingomonas sp.]|uniref:thiamine phosphate synthase n=1 Tax=Sphingomonas sp. TaxID=28214 RepID=UPI001B149F10|nr:thiamine phosphate synthase [Sphingomonas sp.]MBO9714724.1 thiamine phosphate synthase [Sphingomonas sp.]
MRPRHPPIPRLWLMTDPRQGESLWTALERLPCGAGVVFRHYQLAPAERRALFRKIAKVAQRRRLTLVAAGEERLGRGPLGIHNRRGGPQAFPRTAAAHSRREAITAIRSGVDAIFVSPVFASRSHPGAKPLGRVRFGLLVRDLGAPVIALGGMDARRARSLSPMAIHGWAAIDAWG